MGGGQWAGGSVGGLVEAVQKGRPRHVQLLLEAGVEVNGQDPTGTRPLVAAVTHWGGDEGVRDRVMRELLRAGADANLGDARGTTPLMHAVAQNLTRAALTLLQHEGVDPGVQDGDGNSALMYAAAHGHREALLLVLAAFRSLHRATFHGQKNAQGLTAWQLAERNGHTDLATLLKVETGPFPHPTAFAPAHLQDLDRPPTPNESTCAGEKEGKRDRSSNRRIRIPASSQPPSRAGPTDPLPPPAFLAFGRAFGGVAPTSTDSEGEAEGLSTRCHRLLTATPTQEWLRAPPGAGVRRPRVAKGSSGSDSEESQGSSSKHSSRHSSSAGDAQQPWPVHVPPPDEEERRALHRLMTGSPESGNEGDTESLMEVDRSAAMAMAAAEDGVSRGAASRKAGAAGPGAAMPRLPAGACSRSLNRSIAALVQEDAQQRPDNRPPTPARPSLPTLLPARLLDAPLAASLGSSRVEARPAQRRITLASFPRSSSEPRSLLSPGGIAGPPDTDDSLDGLPLDASTRSEGWEVLRGARGRPPSLAQPSDGHVVPLPPINRPRYVDGGGRGRTSGRGRSRGGDDGDVLSVAKKTLEHLETVLAPHEGPAAPRPPHRTRAAQHIHLQT